LADLGELAADGGLGGVGQRRAVAFRRQRHFGFAAREARDAALAFTLQRAAPRRVHIGHLDPGFEGRLHRPDLERRCRLEMRSSVLLISWQPGMQALRISGSLSAAQSLAGAGTRYRPVKSIASGAPGMRE
jgi:hypothetical protein